MLTGFVSERLLLTFVSNGNSQPKVTCWFPNSWLEINLVSNMFYVFSSNQHSDQIGITKCPH